MRGLSRDWNATSAKLRLGRRRKHRSYAHNAAYRRPLRVEPLEDRRMLAILTVNSAVADTHINTDGVLTLREAIEVVNQGNINGLDSATIQNQINGAITSNNIIRFDPSLNGDEILLKLPAMTRRLKVVELQTIHDEDDV